LIFRNKKRIALFESCQPWSESEKEDIKIKSGGRKKLMVPFYLFLAFYLL